MYLIVSTAGRNSPHVEKHTLKCSVNTPNRCMTPPTTMDMYQDGTSTHQQPTPILIDLVGLSDLSMRTKRIKHVFAS